MLLLCTTFFATWKLMLHVRPMLFFLRSASLRRRHCCRHEPPTNGRQGCVASEEGTEWLREAKHLTVPTCSEAFLRFFASSDGLQSEANRASSMAC